jgi:uncharacterized protein (UPF0303 family)
MEKAELESLVAELEAQEAELRFPSFSNGQGIALGAAIARKARDRGQAIAVDVRRCGQQIYHCALDGTTPDNDQWIARKARTVERFGHASFLIGARLKLFGLGMEEKHFVSSLEYSSHGGSFPVFIEGTGLVGSVTVSGLPQEEDHALVVECIREFLASAPKAPS